jgi:hypothetical protein
MARSEAIHRAENTHPRHSGTRHLRGPGIHNHETWLLREAGAAMAFSQQAPVVMDSGLDASHRPGMTNTVIPGRAAWRGTGIHNHETSLLREAGATAESHNKLPWLWIPGSMLRIAPE